MRTKLSSVKLNADTLDYAIFAADRAAFMGDSFQLLTSIEKIVRAGKPIDGKWRQAVDDLTLGGEHSVEPQG